MIFLVSINELLTYYNASCQPGLRSNPSSIFVCAMRRGLGLLRIYIISAGQAKSLRSLYSISNWNWNLDHIPYNLGEAWRSHVCFNFSIHWSHMPYVRNLPLVLILILHVLFVFVFCTSSNCYSYSFTSLLCLCIIFLEFCFPSLQFILHLFQCRVLNLLRPSDAYKRQ